MEAYVGLTEKVLETFCVAKVVAEVSVAAAVPYSAETAAAPKTATKAAIWSVRETCIFV